jgi:hypothetical protein
MPDPVQDITPVPRKRRRWIVVAGVVLLLLIAGWRFRSRESLIARARLVKEGQTRQEVQEILGPARFASGSSDGTSSHYYIEKTSLELFLRIQIEKYFNVPAYPTRTEHPVQIDYDAERRVKRVHIRE